ncbi:pyruvate, phosphate dikinase [Finegoldia magna]|uniref:pyruvate, phosphate dikinase n=1 Tax=Finegoldia magna TaxID=1260 RepID=UPI000B919822|nr:pyruvate, phosphate dikinase [Finegoldia magna]MDU2131287.1 pyruvate, phosphate dikinase [Finegoldia magna]MDU4277159.1 pyruvate, phosphate dikinase [Finegoldia magna]MDU5069639.1 pyruvate, phosphate dikinase [Finegoldia magna]MDU6552846.1 pyruvate, phosphate dikinase [Finegoldia magna]OXZ34761.1 pyruvate, phosphate dikinase [Finegoldia magna]
MTEKYVYGFKEGNKDMRSLLGGKGANLAEMTNMDIPVPTGFTITTEACNKFYQEDEKLWDGLFEEIKSHIEETEKELNKKFSDEENPLLFSVRSGAVISMPGMMDTILNLGLNDKSVIGLAKSTNNERFAYDSYRRFIQMFSDVAREIPKVLFENELDKIKEEKNVTDDTDLDSEDLKKIVEKFKEIYKEEMGEEFPQDPIDQLRYAIEAVFRSWNNPRAKIYRQLNGIDDNLGTAVNIQSMVFGNMGNTSGTGVAFSRNPATGENKLFGEFLMNAQGEDVVAGIRTPQPISQLQDVMPEVYEQFHSITKRLEEHYRDMQDLEFTIENSKLYLLQTRNGKRTAISALNVAVDQVNEGLISKEEAILRIEPNSLNQLLHPTFDQKELENAEVITKGLAASPGAASGHVYFSAEDCKTAASKGIKSILVRQETSPEDIEGMIKAEGILTARGGMTSHAAVVARGMGACCVAGASEIRVDEENKVIRGKNIEIKEGDLISLDGSTGYVYKGEISKVSPELTGNFAQFMQWVDEIKRLGVKTNADTPKDAHQAKEFGAEGIGLTRTEHMFFNEERIPIVRQMILSNTTERRQKALDKLRPFQEDDFYNIYKEMGDLSVTIRLLDPPLHEFLPKEKHDIEELAKEMDLTYDEVNDIILELHEVNPMLGHRGCRLAVTYPEIYRMQARAIISAALKVKEETSHEIVPQIMIPLVGEKRELKYVKDQIIEEINQVFEETNQKLDYQIGTMIEIPRACLMADEIAEEADFFSFGTNDLTQMSFGFSRDDAGKFLSEYKEKKIYSRSPFERLDQEGVGQLIKIAIERGKSSNANLHVGICGEHGGDPESVEFCHRIGLDYVSCSPYRVPIARLAAAQAAAREKLK